MSLMLIELSERDGSTQIERHFFPGACLPRRLLSIRSRITTVFGLAVLWLARPWDYVSAKQNPDLFNSPPIE
jgi:hypothetical protein